MYKRQGLTLIAPFSIGWGGFMFVLAVALQEGLRLGPMEAGLALVPMCATFLAGSLAGPRLVARFERRVVTAGAVIQGVGLAVVAATFWFGWDGLGALGLAPGLAVQGLGQGLLMPVTMRLVLSEVPVDRAGVGGGVLVTTQQAFMALGVATLGSLFLSLTPSGGMREALEITLGVQLVVVVATVLLSLRLPRSVR